MREASNGKYEQTAFSIDSYEDEQHHDGVAGDGDGTHDDHDVDVDDLFMEEGNEEEGAAYSSGGHNNGGYHGGSGGERTLELRQLRRRSLRTKAVILLCLAVSLGVLVVSRSYWENRVSAESSQASPDGDVNSAQQYASAAAGTSEPPPGAEEEKEAEAAEKEAEAEEEEEEEEEKFEEEEEEEEEAEEKEKAIKGVGDTEDQHDKISHESVDDETDTKAEEALEPDVGLDLDFDSEGVACIGERLNNGVQLKSGEFLCAHEKNFKFGMTSEGHLVWRDEAGDETRTYYRGTPGSYFVLQPDGAMTVFGKKNKIKWNKECKATIHLSEKCLPTKKNIYDCPYFHLHGGEKGPLVLNWIADDGNWESHNFKRWYDV